MITDSYFEIGNTHDVCQDYALSGKLGEKFAYAIITDGCSQSHKESGEVDLGARIVAYAARKTLFNYLEEVFEAPKAEFRQDNLEDDRKAKTFECLIEDLSVDVGETVVKVREEFGLNPIFSDSTLLVAITDGKIAYVYVFGDGGIIVKTNGGETIYDEISYLSSAPYYLSYALNKEREAQYRKEYGASPVIHTNHVIPFDGGIEDAKITHRQAKEINPDIYKFSSFIYRDFSSISVTSDGIKSFQNLEADIKDVRAIEMVPRFVDFKGKSPVFLKRRMLMIKKENTNKKISHYDDVSVASILV